jgi:hypothetical protein
MALSIDNDVPFVCSEDSLGIAPTAKETSTYRDTIFKRIKFKDIALQNFHTHVDPDDFSYKKIEYKKNTILTGYYQSEKYFKHREEEVKKLFECPEEISASIQERFSNILKKDNTCSVHIRRGDYLKYKDYHNNLTENYYNTCFDIKKGSHFVFFSDDIEWCKKRFTGLDATFLNTESDVIDFYLMSLMKDNIIANSSFSWWGAWLNNNKDKHVIAPKKWFGDKLTYIKTEDITPNSWELVDA